MIAPRLVSRGTRGTWGTSFIHAGLRGSLLSLGAGDPGNQKDRKFPRSHLAIWEGNRWRAFIHAGVPQVPQVPCPKMRFKMGAA